MKGLSIPLTVCIGLMASAGCSVNVKGRERPVVMHERIQGALELLAETRTDEQGVAETRRESETTVFEERLNLRTRGNVYHPNLLLYDIALGLGLAQQDFTFDEGSGKTDAILDTYALTLQFLRAKAYPLTISVSKSDDLIAREFLGSLRSERESASVTFSLKLKDWPMTFQYSTSDTRQDSLSELERDFFARQSNRFKYTLDHEFSKYSHMRFEYDRDDISQESLGVTTDIIEDRYTLTHDLTFGKERQHRLDSFVSFIEQSGNFFFETLRWDERLRLQHTDDFATNYELRYADSKEDTFRNEETRLQAGFEHSLYESLFTTGNVFVSQSNLGDQGELSQDGGAISFNYQKKNPWGLLLSTYGASIVRTEQTGGGGTGIVTDEQHTATSLFPVQLNRTNIDVSSIRVKDAPGPGLLFQLGDDYTITEINGRVRLNIITVGGVIPPNFTEGQQFFVDYTFFIEPEREEKTVRQNFTIRERFKNGFSTYFRHQRQDEDITSTLTEITPDEFRINTFGAEYLKGGLSLVAEHSDEESTQIPSRSTRLEARYDWAVSSGTNVSVWASNHWLDFGEPDARDITRFDAGTEVFGRLTDRFSISGRIDYRNEEDSRFGPTEGFELISSLQYDYRLLSISTGVELDLLTRRNDEINSTYWFFRLVRSF
jgi:hypothetical protein